MRKKTLLHKVTCATCGRTERIEIEPTGKIHSSNWRYFGKVNINGCQTSKNLYRLKEGKSLFNKDAWIKEKNPCYNPKVKRRMVEIWECGCQR